MTTASDRYLECFPGHVCTDDCVPPVPGTAVPGIHFTCMVLAHPLRADEHLYYLAVFRWNGFSIEALHPNPPHPHCLAEFPDTTHHYSWWSMPLELLEDQ